MVALFVPSLKAPEAAGWLRGQIARLAPDAIINATAFSGKGDDGRSPLDAAGVPVFQVALATSTRDAWAKAERGLSPSDLAMHVVLPEVDGRILAGVASFKQPGPRDPHLQFSRFAHQADAERIEAITKRIMGWLKLAGQEAGNRRVAMVLSTYPGKDWNMGHAVGLDALQSAGTILADLASSGYDAGAGDAYSGDALQRVLAGCETRWPLANYKAALEQLPASMRADLQEAWGTPEDDPDARDGAFHFTAARFGKIRVALQPERGLQEGREDSYHDLSRVPRHAYVAFYLWLQDQADALVHIGAHGTLEWLPGKSVALSGACWPEALTGALPVIYPFIVNDPGEAAQAKRRIGAVTLGHIPRPCVTVAHRNGCPVLRRCWMNFPTRTGLIHAGATGFRVTSAPKHRPKVSNATWGLTVPRAVPRPSPALTALSVTSKRASLAKGCISGAAPQLARRPLRPLSRQMGNGNRFWMRWTDDVSRPDPPGRPIGVGPTCCPRGAICTRQTRARCRPAPPMLRACGWQRS